jgi:hypothetical protein
MPLPVIPVKQGGTGLTSLSALPISTAQQAALDLKADKSQLATPSVQRFSVADGNLSAGQTTITVSSYTPGTVMVFLNGSKLPSSSYTALSGTTVVLADAALATDIIEILSWLMSGVQNAAPLVHQHSTADLTGPALSQAMGGTGATSLGAATVAATGGTVSRPVADWFADTQTAAGAAVPSDGTDATTSLKAFIEGLSGKRGFFGKGTYFTNEKTVGSDYTQHPAAPAKLALSYTMDPGATFTGTGYLSLRNIIPWQGEVFAASVYTRQYDPGDVGGLTGGNIFQVASYAKANLSGPAVVAVYGQGEATTSGARAWGGNLVGTASASGATGIALELNALSTVAGGLSYGLVVHAAGFAPTTAAINIGSNSPESTFTDAITFNVQDVIRNGSPVESPPFSGCLIKMPNTTVTHGVNLSAAKFTGSEWWSSNLIIGPTNTTDRTSYIRLDSNANISSRAVDGTSPAPITYNPANGGQHQFLVSGVQQFQVRGGSDSVDYMTAEGGIGAVVLNIRGSSTDVNFNQYAKGTGKHQFLTGSTSAVQVQISDTAGATDFVKLTGGVGGDVVITSGGSSTNSSIVITGRGSGGGKMRDGTSAIKFQWNTTGVGFNASAPIAKPTISGSRGGNAALADLLTKLATYGLITDGTTA